MRCTCEAPKGQHPRNLSGARTTRARQLWRHVTVLDRRGACVVRSNPSGARMSIDHLVPVTTGTSTETVMADFVSRHVGPAGDDVRHMLEVVGQPSLDAMCDRAIPGAIRSESPLRIEAAASESAVIEELRGFASRNSVLTSLIGLGYYGTVTPAGRAPQRPREPRLVHRLHALPARDLPGPPRGPAQLPDGHHRPHRARRRGLVAPRRVDRRGGGDVAHAPRQQGTCRRRRARRRAALPADDRRDAHAGRRARTAPASSPTCAVSPTPTPWPPPPTASLSSAASCSTPTPPARSSTGRP